MNNEQPEAEGLDTRWPKDGDRLFVESARTYDAHIVRDPRERLYRLPKGYKRAGDILVEQAEIEVADRVNIVYAALFCYRHAIELFLKSLIDEFGKGKVYSPRHIHELSRLWERFMCMANERGRAESVGLSAVQRLIAEMDQADQKSDGFRFAADRDDTPFTFGDRGIDLTNLHEVMHGLENFFECAYLDFSQQDDTP